LPIAGDWNNDGIDTIGVFRSGTFYLRNANSAGWADLAFNFGNATSDLPIAGIRSVASATTQPVCLQSLETISLAERRFHFVHVKKSTLALRS
jgi:hypothetical protein